MYYDNYNFGGMHLLWWFVWTMLIFWIFVLPYNIPGQRTKTQTALDILKKRFASGEITQEQYWDYKSTIEKL